MYKVFLVLFLCLLYFIKIYSYCDSLKIDVTFDWKGIERNADCHKKVTEQNAIVRMKMPQILKKCGKMHSDHAAEVLELDAMEAISSRMGMFRVNVLLLLLFYLYFRVATFSFDKYILEKHRLFSMS